MGVIKETSAAAAAAVIKLLLNVDYCVWEKNNKIF